MKLSSIKIDPVAVEDGQWIRDLPEMDDLEVRVRGLENDAYRRLRAKLLKTIPRSRRIGGNLSLADSDRLTTSLLLETILIDWRGLEDDAGQPTPYSRELAEKLLTDPDSRRFRDAVSYAASLVGEAGTADEEADTKN